MSGFMKLVLILFGLAYLISPVDLIPDLLLPWLGWIDDGVILWSVYYLIRYGELPWFIFRKKAGGRFPGRPTRPGRKAASDSGNRSKGPGSQPGSGTGNQKAAGGPGSTAGQTGRPPSGKRPGKKSPHEILGVPPDASRREIQQAYKEKIKQYHPDKLSHLGKEFADLANEKFLEIQAAYETLIK
ncbi:MAG: DnaJ domain-containing protein [Desulfobacter sp.]|nr:MAG: DnaJ domain-containing protein [Desulfobacter sp.]